LQAKFHGTTFPLGHCHHGKFQMAGDAFETRMPVTFLADVIRGHFQPTGVGVDVLAAASKHGEDEGRVG
jgi:hypothetical protein